MGSPGCGKTTIGRILAGRLGWPLVDVDNDYLESYWGMTVAEKVRTLNLTLLNPETVGGFEGVSVNHDML